jgi:predicted HTH transcriptional regulator
VDVLKNEHTQTGQLITYSDQEKKLLEYLGDEGRITLKQFSKLTRSSYKQAQKILVSFILADLIQPHTSEKEEYFTRIETK